MSNNVDLLSPPLTHSSPLSPSVCTCYRYCEWCSTVSFSSLRCFVSYRYALKIKWHSKRHCNWNKLAAPLTLHFTCAVIYICRKKCMNLFALFVFHQKKTKRKRNREWAAATRPQNPHVPCAFSHTSPHCISDTGRHFSALHIYKWTYVWICIVLYVSCGKQALLRASISGLRLFVCHCQCSTCNVLVSAGPGSLYNLSSAYTHTHTFPCTRTHTYTPCPSVIAAAAIDGKCRRASC